MLARMSRLIRTHVEVYVFRRRAGRVEFLCLQRSPGRSLPGAWQPVTGKVRRGEHADRAAAREVREETGLEPRRWWALESVTIYFDATADAIRALPLFAAEVGARERVTLSREHVACAWLPARAAGNRYVWEAQRRGLAAVRAEVFARPRLARALELGRTADRSARRSKPTAPRAPSSRTRAPRPRAG